MKNITHQFKAKLRAGLLLTAVSCCGCMATVGVSNMSVPSDSAQTCASLCESIGLTLSAVAIMANNVGCVCERASGATAGASTVGQQGTTAGGMAAVVMQQAARTQQYHAQRQ